MGSQNRHQALSLQSNLVRFALLPWHLYHLIFFSGTTRFMLVVPAPESEAGNQRAYKINYFGESEQVGNCSDKQDYRNLTGIVKHQLQGKDAALDPIRSQFLDGSLRRYVDEIDSKAGGEHDKRHKYEQKRIGVPAVGF